MISLLKNTFVSLLFVGLISAQGNWERINSPTFHNLRDVFFLDSLQGWISGDSGIIYKTTDGCKTWQNQSLQTNEEIREIFFLNDSLGWTVIWNLSNPLGSLIYKSTNGGRNWSEIKFYEDMVFLTTIHFLDSLNGFTGGAPSGIYYSNDGGSNWNKASIDSGLFTNFPILDYRFINSNVGFACGGFMDIIGVIWKTIDGGKNWHAYGVSTEPLQKLYIFDSSKVWAVGGDLEFGAGIVRTTDTGQNWSYESLNSFGMAMTISFRTSKEAWAPLGFSSVLIYSLDSGYTWTEISTPDSIAIYDLEFTDSLHGFAVGDHGRIYKYKLKPNYINENKDDQFVDDFILYQNYPNPFNPTTVIKFKVEELNRISLKVFDVLGKEVETVLEEEKFPGIYEVVFPSTNKLIQSGVYFYQLKVGNNIKTKKMILLH